MQNLIAMASHGPAQFPLKAAREIGTMQVDVFGRRLKFACKSSVNYAENQRFGPLSGAQVTANQVLAFDAAQGFISLASNGIAMTRAGQFAIDFCMKVKFPPHLLPPG